MRQLLRLCGAAAPAVALCLALSSPPAFSSSSVLARERAQVGGDAPLPSATMAGDIIFAHTNYGVREGNGPASITLSRTKGTSGVVAAMVTLADVTTSPADYVFKPGARDPGFAPFSSGNSVFAVAGQPDGKIIAAGFFAPVYRLNTDGTVDTSFNVPGSGVNAIVTSVAVQPDGKVLIGGYFTFINGTSRGHVARLNADGTLDTTFNPGTGANGNAVFALALQADGKVLIGGDFSAVDGVARNGLARLNADGSLDTAFGAEVGVSQSVKAILVQPDGKILLGGQFSRVSGTTRGNVARVNSDGTLDTTFDPGTGASDSVLSIARQSTGKIVIGGSFLAVNGSTQNRIARLNADGSLDATFSTGTGADNWVQALAVQPDDAVVIAGSFGNVNGAPRNRIARLTSGGALDTTFDNVVSTGGNPFVSIHSLFIQPDVKIVVGSGEVVFSGGSGAVYCFRLNGDLFATWADGDGADKVVSLPVVDDGLAESPETLSLSLTPLGGATAGAPSAATLTIADTDIAPSITSGAPPSVINLGSPYGHTFTATGVPTTSFSLASGTLPTGLTLTPGGLLSGTPTSAGTFTNIVVKADNGVTPAATQTFSIKVNTPPTVAADSYQVAAGSTLSVAAPGVLANDADADNDALAATLVATTSHGALALAANGSFIYTPAAGFSGADSFTYKAGDGVAESAITTVSLTVNSSFRFGQSAYNVGEGGTLTVMVRRAGDPSLAASVDYATDDGSTPSVAVPCSSTTGLALDRCDFTKALGTLSFAPGETEKTFRLLVGDDSYAEGPETLTLRLSNPAGGAVLGANASAIVTVADDSPESAGNPIDDATKFVTQHYRDFLNRDPDADGLAFWVGGITACGNDAQCREVKRVDTSAAFFLSIENQETGYLTHRAYKAAYGDLPNKPVPLTLREYLSGTRRIGEGVQVGVGDWQQQLEANKAAFFDEFVTTPRFATSYGALTNAQYVDALNANVGGALSQAERDALVAALGGGATTRARALRAVAEDADFAGDGRPEKNRAFVLAQYFGYLRRDPDAPDFRGVPDPNFDGYNFWLAKLDQFGGDFVRAEMVRAFIESIEYRRRFGQ